MVLWHYHIPAAAFDEFICSHSAFCKQANPAASDGASAISYHFWFVTHRDRDYRPGVILDAGLLYDIGAENPYTFALVRSSMELLAARVSTRPEIPKVALAQDTASRETFTAIAGSSNDLHPLDFDATGHEAVKMVTGHAAPIAPTLAQNNLDPTQTVSEHRSTVSDAGAEQSTQRPRSVPQASETSYTHNHQEIRQSHHQANAPDADSRFDHTDPQAPLTGPSATTLGIRSVPSYRSTPSSQGRNQIKAAEWITEQAKKKFDGQQDALLATYGVTAEHSGTCVLVPKSWSGLNPLDLMNDFAAENCPPSDDRLPFSMNDHRVLWARAASWFDSEQWPRTGIELDNFVGLGPYKPKDGSHRCHHSTCINQHHLRYEDSDINSGRGECYKAARFIRKLDFPIPKHCPNHEAPCLMQHAALTDMETYMIQFAVISMVKGLPPLTMSPPMPADHPFPTFEYRLPLPFGDSIKVDTTHLTKPGSQSLSLSTRAPSLICNFCSRVHTYKRPTALWIHIRDKHDIEDKNERLEEIKSIGARW